MFSFHPTPVLIEKPSLPVHTRCTDFQELSPEEMLFVVTVSLCISTKQRSCERKKKKQGGLEYSKGGCKSGEWVV